MVTMVIIKNCLNLKLYVDDFKFYIYNKICLLFFNICISLSLLLILKRVDGRTYINS